ncbi:hypothetical protein M1771_00495 [Spiroplasma citri]|uniref:Transmembrane protein n=1 Tax=Spiroplasma citri TaxID=2133 RepID=A0AAX3SZI9_SPICI|nr:hypothetical protein [Spiroplasma citri]WFG96528.1 hypothetical protein M0C40_00485 [Spiroplasma citri]WFH00424.1 hypothetical protein M1771_00495 [Spiroplasma citri]
MEIIRIRSYLKKIKWYLLWLFVALGLVTIIFIIIFLALKNISSQDKLIYCSIFLVVNLIILFINYLIIKNPFIFSKIYYYDNEKNRLRLSLYFYFFVLIITIVFFFLTLISIQLILKTTFSLVIKQLWYVGLGCVLWSCAIIGGFNTINLIILNKPISPQKSTA